MIARMTAFKIDAGRSDDATQISKEQIAPAMRELPGFERYLVFADLHSGDTVVLTIWDSAEAELASRGSLASRFVSLADLVVASPLPSKVFTVVDQA
jgi:heme-degrading monooxygenase HmoA